MKIIDLSVGSTIFFQDMEYEIKKQIDTGHVLAKNLKTYRDEILPVVNLVNNESVKAKERIEDISESDWEEAKRRLQIIKPIIDGALGKKEIIEIAEKLELHFTTLYRWINRYKETGLLQSLVPLTSMRGPKGKIMIDEEAEIITKKAIETLYLTKQKLPVKDVYREIVKRCKNANVTSPHENTVRNRINQLSKEHTIAKRESRQIADRKYKNTDGMFPEGTFPLDVIQIDHTPMDIILVDEVERKPIGRPYLTLAIDVYSRMVVGYYIALEAPSYFSVSQCLSNVILTKERYLQKIGVEGEWNVWGVPKSIHMDNAQEFRSEALKRFCEQYGITIMMRPVARPQFGGHIERLIGTTMKEVHTLPGTTFSNITQRGQYKSDKEAAMTLAELEKWIGEFIVNVYHKRMHRSINMSPEEKFEEGIFGTGEYPGIGLPFRVADEDRLRIDLLPSIERTVQQHGVVIEKIKYYGDVLRRWINSEDERGGARKFLFKIDPRDISRIFFFDPEIKEYFPIPYRTMS
ncbi:DDE-type integrase/transposase/recombinase, partial [Sulfuricurvum sp.]|uniref:DDE-type integrase/transposase/recombinase n=1 Tax=Sulfuricurvum sp. TaxID=2025608 RepID=UPI002E31DF44